MATEASSATMATVTKSSTSVKPANRPPGLLPIHGFLADRQDLARAQWQKDEGDGAVGHPFHLVGFLDGHAGRHEVVLVTVPDEYQRFVAIDHLPQIAEGQR